MNSVSRRIISAGAVACLLAAAAAGAQSYPTKPVRIIVPWAAGGAVDTVTRTIGQKLAELWKHPVVVDNRGGAGGNIGAEAVAKAAPDGYTLLATSNSIVLSPSLYRKLPYDAAKDFVPLAQLTSSYFVLTVHPTLQVGSVNEFIEHAKARPGGIPYGSVGIGGAQHLVMERFKGRAGLDLMHVPYKGDAQLTPALLSGEVRAAFMTPSSVVMHVKAGKLRALAVTKLAPTAVFEGVPILAESLPGFEYSGYQGLYAPTGTPGAIVAQIKRDVAGVLAMSDVKARLAGAGFEPPTTTPDQFPERYHRDIATFAQIVREARIPQQE